MTFWGLFLIIAVITLVLSFALKGILSEKNSTEIMLLGLLLIFTGGILLIEPNLPKNTMIILIEFGFIIFGFLVGVLGFFKD